jgi:uncharacterized protein YjbI with pentapeptide repeats
MGLQFPLTMYILEQGRELSRGVVSMDWNSTDRRIRLACPWAEPFLHRTCADSDPAFLAARRAASLARLSEGTAAWHNWAVSMTELLEEGASSPRISTIEAVAMTDFAGMTFSKAADFAAFLFPGETCFERTRFQREAYFNACTFVGSTSFRGAEFSHRGAWFENGQFDSDASFMYARWKGAAEFRSTTFKGAVTFAHAVFEGDLWIAAAVFCRSSNFAGTIFQKEGGFGSSKFYGEATFSDTCFGGNAGFTAAAFGTTVTFERAVFEKKAWFNGCRFGDLARFRFAEFHGGADFHSTELAAQIGAASSCLAELQRRFGSQGEGFS